MKPQGAGKEPLNPIELADMALDGDVAFDDLFSAAGPRGERSAAAHVRVVRRLERLLRIERNAAKMPDFTSSVLAEVGTRRGWLDRSSRRLVWGGRVLAAAAVLAALGTGLAVRRVAPEILPSPAGSSALASMVHAGESAAAVATAPLASVVESIEDRTPVLVHLTNTLASESGTIWRFSVSGDAPGMGRAMLVNYEVSPGPLPRRIAVSATLDEASLGVVEAVSGADRTPRWLRVSTRVPCGTVATRD